MPRLRQTQKKWTRELVNIRLRQQFAVAGDAQLAKAIAAASTISQINNGIAILQAGDPNAALHFILEGCVEIKINGTHVASRVAGEMIGEIAILANIPRIATAIAKGKVVTAVLKPEDALRIGSSFPAFWANVAGQLARRLYQRSAHIRRANVSPAVFLGSSSEDCGILKHITKSLRKNGITAVPWNDPFKFQPSGTTIEELLETASQVDFAILILTPIDLLSSRGRRNQPTPRDNVIFEAGLFMGHLGRFRTILMCEHSTSLKIPSDLWGLTNIRFEKPSSTRSTAYINDSVAKVLHHIKKWGTR